MRSSSSSSSRRKRREKRPNGRFERVETNRIFCVAIGKIGVSSLFDVLSPRRRFIPRRTELDCDLALDRFVSENFRSIKPKKRSTRRTLKLLEEILPQNRRIYNFGVKTHPKRALDPSDVARRIEALTITSKERYISSTPERILDAPDLIDDFCSLLTRLICS